MLIFGNDFLICSSRQPIFEPMYANWIVKISYSGSYGYTHE